MKHLSNFGDARTLMYCAFCGGTTGTRDHCPSKIFLDTPLPENLPVVPACAECNNGFSVDEEYLACFLSSVLAGSTEPEAQGREKTRRILSVKSALRERIERSKRETEGGTRFIPEYDRARNVLIKLAQGHALYELHESCSTEPDYVMIVPFPMMSDTERAEFEQPVVASVWPEVGSRAMQRLVQGTDLSQNGWIVVQEGRYRYSATINEGRDVRIVIDEYLAAQIYYA